MVSNKLKNPKMRLITISSKQDLSDKDRDFIAELVSEEARKVREFYSFILHDIVESRRSSKILIEGGKVALTNLVAVLKDNLHYKISYGRRML